MAHHMWTIEEWDIVNVGFICGASPRHQSKDTILYKLENIKKSGLRFHLHGTSINATAENIQYKTYAYEVKCNCKDADEVANYIGETGPKIEQTMVKYRWKYTNKDIFINAMKKQTDFINNVRTIPVYGIIPEAMDLMIKPLIKKNNILEVGGTAKITTHGCWNIYTTYKQFQHTTQWIQNNLENMYNSIKDLDHSNVPTGFTPQVRFNTTISFQEEKPDPLLATTEQSVKSYSTKISTTQTWASIAGNYSTGSSITPNSGLTKSIENLQNTIERMCKRLDKIEDFAQTRTGA